MPAKYFIVDAKADKQLAKLAVKLQKKIVFAYDRIQENPLIGASLHGEMANYYKYRVGDYRIIYLFDKKMSTVNVVKIEHRQGVYK